jgi:CBS domain-containing protein
MQVSEVMTRKAECIAPEANLQKAAQRMKALDIGALPVCDHDRLTGMLTDRDIILRCVSEGHDPKQDRVRDAMTRQIVYCFEDDDVTRAAELMKSKQVRRLPVLNRGKRLVGILALGDLAVETGVGQLAGQALEGLSQPSSPKR